MSELAAAGRVTVILFWTMLALMPGAAAQGLNPPLIIGHIIIDDAQVTAYIPRILGSSPTEIRPEIVEKVNQAILRKAKLDLASFRADWDGFVRTAPEHTRKHLHYWMSYAVKLNREKLLSLTIEEYYYTGGAHGDGRVWGLSFDLESGRSIKLADVFKPGADFHGRLESLIRSEIARRGLTKYWFDGIKNDQQFYLTEEGLVIYFQPYEIAPWVYGVPRFIVSYQELSDILNPRLRF